MMATKACKFASVQRSLNLERLSSGNKSLVCINAECTLETLTVALTGTADIFFQLACSTVGKTDTLIKSHVSTQMKEKPIVYELLKLQIGKMISVQTNT